MKPGPTARVLLASLGVASVVLAGCVAPSHSGAGPFGPKLENVTPASPPIPATGGGTFRLLWQDDFDRFDRSRWRLMTHSFETNLAVFSTTNTRFDGGVVYLDLKQVAGDEAKPFRGVEMRSLQALTYGRVEARARFARGSGVVSSLVTIYTPWPADDWNELDFEFLGAFRDRIQTNAMIYSGPPVSRPVRQAVSPTAAPEMTSLPFDPSADFHRYTIEWTPTEARFLIDDKLTRTWTDEISRMKLPQNVLLTIWASAAGGWAGEIDGSTAPTSAAFDWLRLYSWQPPGPP